MCDCIDKTIDTEIKEIIRFRKKYNKKSVSKAIEILKNTTGKIIVMGLGKSGHVGRKMAATFASTGTPSFFVHPSEALHGDLGMISHGDVCILISHSGDTEELIEVMKVLKKFDVKCISITSNENSKIAKKADCNIDTLVKKEALLNGIAPSSSTTLTMIIGDALTSCLIENNGLSEPDFALRHPSGSLGKRLLTTVDHLASTDKRIPTIDINNSFEEALHEMTKKGFGTVCVLNEKKELEGILTDGDLRRILLNQKDINKIELKKVLTKNPIIITGDMKAVEALALMEEKRITSLIICKNKKVKGIIHMHQLLDYGLK